MMGYTTAQVLERIPGTSYRQVDHWVRQDWCRPVLEGRDRVWTPRETRVAVVMARLVKAGMHAPDAARIARSAINVSIRKPYKTSVAIRIAEGVAIYIEVGKI